MSRKQDQKLAVKKETLLRLTALTTRELEGVGGGTAGHPDDRKTSARTSR